MPFSFSILEISEKNIEKGSYEVIRRENQSKDMVSEKDLFSLFD